MSDSAIQKRQAAFYTLEYYQNEMGRLLRRGQENLLNRIQQTLGSGVSLESVNPIVARDFPRYLRYSFIALLVSFAENELEELCIEMGQDKGLSDLGCLKWLLAVDRFLDSRCQSRLSSAWWRSIFKEQGVIQARQLRAMEIFVSI